MSADDEREQQIQAVLHSYLQALDAGEARSQDEIVRQYPHLADELRAFFSDQEKLNQLADSLRTQGPPRGTTEPPTIDSAASLPGNGPLGSVRYFGDYELLQEIARGGMGVVYRAKQVSLNRLVALKMILAGQLASPSDVQRFHTEAEAAANLDYPNIVPIYEVGEHEGQLWQGVHLVDCRERPVLTVRQVLRTHTEPVTCLAFSHDGNFLATASEDKTVRLLGLSLAEGADVQ